MPLRFLLDLPADGPPPVGTTLQLPGERAHYLCKVLRARSGQSIECFDGRGYLLRAQVTRADTRQAILQITAIEGPLPRPEPAIHLGISLLKGQAMDRALQLGTELGAASITLIHAARSNVTLPAQRVDNKQLHWHKIIAGACEQCGRAYLPELYGPQSVAEFISNAHAQERQLMVLDQNGAGLPGHLPPADHALLVGPEGGWDAAELALFEHHRCARYRLVETVMRAETVPAVALALIHHIWTSRIGQD